jgi:hypothetical protein
MLNTFPPNIPLTLLCTATAETITIGCEARVRVGPRGFVPNVVTVAMRLLRAQEKFIRPLHPKSWFLLFFNNLGNLLFVQR